MSNGKSDRRASPAPSRGGWGEHGFSAGAGFLVVIAGSMVLMPGLPKASRALTIDVDENGEIIGM